MSFLPPYRFSSKLWRKKKNLKKAWLSSNLCHLSTTQEGGGSGGSPQDQCLKVGSAYVIVYSVTDRASFDAASELRITLRRIRQAENIPIILVGNKSDLVRSREVAVEGKWRRRWCNHQFVSRKNCISIIYLLPFMCLCVGVGAFFPRGPSLRCGVWL